MAKKVINYEEDIFFLTLMLKSLKDGLKLDIDANFFTLKVKDDIQFIHKLIYIIYKSLSENTYMLKRLEYLKSLQRLMQQFTELLSGIVSRKLLFAPALESSIADFKAIIPRYENDIRTIKHELVDLSGDSTGDVNIVSEEEFKFLLLNEEENYQ